MTGMNKPPSSARERMTLIKSNVVFTLVGGAGIAGRLEPGDSAAKTNTESIAKLGGGKDGAIGVSREDSQPMASEGCAAKNPNPM